MRAVDHAVHILSGTRHQLILYYIKRSLSCILPREFITPVEEVDEHWLACVESEIKPRLERARKILLDAGFSSLQILTRMEISSRRPAVDIVRAAGRDDCGTIVPGRHGRSNARAFTMSNIAREVLEEAHDTVLWVTN